MVTTRATRIWTVLFLTSVFLTRSACWAAGELDNDGLRQWSSRYSAADRHGQSALLSEGISRAHQRRAALAALIEKDPKAALSASDELGDTSGLPAEIVAELETRFTTNADLIIQGALARTNGPAVEPIRRWLHFGGHEYKAYVHGARAGGTTQYNIPVSGIAVDNIAAVAPNTVTPLDEQPNPPSSWTVGPKQILIIRVDFSDLTGAPEGMTAAAVQALADSQVAPYYLKSSYTQTSMTNTVTSAVYRMPYTAASYAVSNANDLLHSNAEAAASANYAVSNYDRIIVFFSSLGNLANSQITYGGLAMIGGKNVWCNGEFDFRVIAHELGHTYGLYHANLWVVTDGNPISAGGTSLEYGDDFDTMSANFANNQKTDFNPWFKNILGWIPDSHVQTITNSGTYRVYAFDHTNYIAASNEVLALKVVKDGTHNYWLNCQANFDTNSYASNGVYTIWGYNYTQQSDLLDINTPGTNDWDAPLLVGGNLYDPAAASGQGVTIHPVARGGTFPNEYRDIQITFGTAPAQAPTIIVNPISQSGVLGQPVIFSVSASGNPAPTYQWQVKPPGGSTFTNLVNNTTYSGVTSSNLTVSISALSMSSNSYQCVASNASGTATTSTAVLTVTPALLITTIAGQSGNGGNANGTGTNATFFYPFSLVCDHAGNIYVAEYWDGAIRKISTSGVVSTLTSGFSGPEGIAIDSGDTLYLCDTLHQQIVRVTTNGTQTVLAGAYQTTNSTDGTNTAATFDDPWGITVDAATNIYVADSDNQTIRKISRIGTSQNWAVTTIGGTPGVKGSTDGTNQNALFNTPASLAIDASNTLYVCDSGNNTIRKMVNVSGTNWVTTTFAGWSSIGGDLDGTGTNAQFYSPSGITLDPSGNLYVLDSYNDLVRFVTKQGVVTTLAGDSFADGTADGFYTSAQFQAPYGITMDAFGNLYIADTFNYTIREANIAQVTVPSLSISLSNAVPDVRWPVATNLFQLQSTTNLAAANWTNSPATTSIITNYYNSTNAVTRSPIYFRLINSQ